MKELTRSHIEYCGRKMVRAIMLNFYPRQFPIKKRSHWLGGFSCIQKHHLRSNPLFQWFNNSISSAVLFVNSCCNVRLVGGCVYQLCVEYRHAQYCLSICLYAKGYLQPLPLRDFEGRYNEELCYYNEEWCCEPMLFNPIQRGMGLYTTRNCVIN